MTDLDNTIYRKMNEVAHEIIRLEMMGRLAEISHSRISNEIHKQLSKWLRMSMIYLVGSREEGIPKSARGDYADVMICETSFPIILWKSQEKEREAFVMAEKDPNIPPVYLRLKVVNRERLPEDFRSIIDKDGYLIATDFNKALNHYQKEKYERYPNVQITQHGPSIKETLRTDFETEHLDWVYCLKCHSWPPCTSGFFTRERLNNWPSQELLHKVKGLECHVVAVGYPGSESYDIEWRLSFSVAERELITEMLEPYAECMVALKAIKKKFIIYSDSDKPTPFCSYFIKTACLWMCETVPHTEYSTMALIRKVLDWLIDCYQHKHLPHYFIPHNNLIGHLPRQSCDNVRETLIAIKRNPCKKVLLSVGDGTGSCENFLQFALNKMCKTLWVPRSIENDNYSKLEFILSIYPEAIETLHLIFTTVNEILTRLAVYRYHPLTDCLLTHMQRNLLDAFSIPEKIMLPIVENIEEIVPKGYGEMFRTILYRFLGNIYTNLLVYLRKKGSNLLPLYENIPFHYYELEVELVFPDNCSDLGIGGQIFVVQHNYLMSNYKELKENCVSILSTFNKENKKCRLACLEVRKHEASGSAWTVDELLYNLFRHSEKNLFIMHPIGLVLYINARVLLIEGDTTTALSLVKKIKECCNEGYNTTYDTRMMFVKIIESLVGFLAVMRRLYLNVSLSRKWGNKLEFPNSQ